MGVAERKGRERAGRERRIAAAARRVAECEGWDAVTIRRLAEEIEYSQPVIYAHFENRDAIVAAVAVEGFVELTARLRAAAAGAADARGAIACTAAAYLDFAAGHVAVYAAMFTLPTGLRFADATTRPELGAAFDALASVVAPLGADVALLTETLWACLHGLAELERSGRIRPRARLERLALLVDGLLGG